MASIRGSKLTPTRLHVDHPTLSCQEHQRADAVALDVLLQRERAEIEVLRGMWAEMEPSGSGH